MNWLGFILHAVLAVQSALPTLKGATKKQLVIGLVQLAAGVSATAPDTHVAEIGNGIENVLAMLQKNGIIVKDQAPVGVHGGMVAPATQP